jgi:hypothetical protein
MNADKISAPEKLSAGHKLAAFDSSEPALDDWLRRRALTTEATGVLRTLVVCVDRRVAGYYTLAAGAIAHADAPGRVTRGYRYGVVA